MKGRVIALDHVGGRAAAALMVDGHLQDLFLDPPEDATPQPGAIYRARAERPMKGQGGLILRLGDGLTGFLRQGRGIAPGETLLVQVSGVAEPGKAVPVTTRLIFKSRYAIVTPGAGGRNLSKRIRDGAEGDRLREIAHEAMADTPEDLGLILRSAAENAEDTALADDIAAMRDLALAVSADLDGSPECLLDAPDAHLLAWRDWSVPEPDMVADAPGSFEEHGVFEAVERLMRDDVVLPGQGGRLWIEATRALIAVDVNTGGDTSLAAGLKANLAAARALPRELRLRGLGGQVLLDLAPMAKKERRIWEQALGRAFREDASEVTLAGWTPLGNFELTRKRDRLPLAALWPET